MSVTLFAGSAAAQETAEAVPAPAKAKVLNQVRTWSYVGPRGYLAGANLITANRSRTSLICASLTGAIFSGGNRFGAIWHYATCSNGTVISTSC